MQTRDRVLPYDRRGPHDDPRIVIARQGLHHPEIAAIVLQEMKHVAEEYLGEP